MKLITLSFVALAMILGTNGFAQKSTFYGQKNIFSIYTQMNPRLIPMNNDKGGQNNYGTYIQKYDENGKVEYQQEKWNFMFGGSYGRILKGKSIISVDFSYQKHNLTMRKESFLGEPLDSDNYSSGWDDDSEEPNMYKKFTASTPVFNMYNISVMYGNFMGGGLAPSGHLLQYGLGLRLFKLNQKESYFYNKDMPITDLSKFISDPDGTRKYFYLTIRYTYRLLITKNLTWDIGLDLKAGLYSDMELDKTAPQQYEDFETNSEPLYDEYYVKGRLGQETLYNLLYLRTGFSFAF